MAFSCNICNHPTEKLSKAHEHSLNHKGYQYECPKCAHLFKEYCEYDNHYRNHHLPRYNPKHKKNNQPKVATPKTDGRVAAAEHISLFNEEARSPFVKNFKTIIHPGEVNRIRELPQKSNIVATHTDSPDVLIWDVDAQPYCHAVLGAAESCPHLILTVHQDNAEFALAMCPTEPFVLSGGKDKSVVIWSIQDHISDSATDSGSAKSPRSKTKFSGDKSTESPLIGPCGIYQGHDDTVEDVQFCPSSVREFCSLGDDFCLILWDARTGTSPTIKVEKAHIADLHCVDWNRHDENLILIGYLHCVDWNRHDENLILIGSADNSVRMFDRRNLTSGGVGSPIYKFEGHKAAVLCVQWCPVKAYVFGRANEDGFLNAWDHGKVKKACNADLHCVDWIRNDENLILTGSPDVSLHIFDRRNLTSGGVGPPIYKFERHKAAVLCVQWCPDKVSVFDSAAKDGFLNVWDHAEVGKKKDRVGTRMLNSPPGLFFQHAGCIDKVDFHLNTSDPCTMVTVSDAWERSCGGGTFQILTGHHDNADFVLAMCPSAPVLSSEGKVKLVVTWSIHDISGS